MARVVKDGNDVENIKQCNNCKNTIVYKGDDIRKYNQWIDEKYSSVLFIYCPHCKRAMHL